MPWTVRFTSPFVFKQCPSWIKDRTSTEVTLARPRTRCSLCVRNSWVCSYPVRLPPSFLSVFDLTFACSRCLVCSALGVKTPPTSPSPSLSLPQSFIHLHGYLPPSCGPQKGWCILPLRACCQPGSALSLQLERGRGGESLLELCFHSVPLLTKAEWETRQQSGVLLRAAAACTPRARARLGLRRTL